jgi:hypothetical protein
MYVYIPMINSLNQAGKPATANIVKTIHTMATIINITFAIGGASLIASGTFRVSKQTLMMMMYNYISYKQRLYSIRISKDSRT